MSPNGRRQRSLASFDRQVVAVDTETTGLGQNGRPPRPDGIVQIGYAWRNPRGKVVRWHATCNPGESYLRGGRAMEALRVNGLRLDTILAAPPARAVAAEFRERLDAIEDESGKTLELRAFNRSFDEPFLRSSPWSIPAERWGSCLMVAAQNHLGLSRWPKLGYALSALGMPPPPGRSHTAEVDAHAALLVHEAISRSDLGRGRRGR